MARENPWTGRHPGRRRNPWVVRQELEAALQQQEQARAALVAAGWKPTMHNLLNAGDPRFRKQLVALNRANVAVTERRAEMYRQRRRR